MTSNLLLHRIKLPAVQTTLPPDSFGEAPILFTANPEADETKAKPISG